MTTYNTGNPIGSTAVQDLYDNAENLDIALHTPETTWVDRLGKTRRSWAGSTGYEMLGDYAPGITVTSFNQIIRGPDGEFWRAAAGATLPYVTTGAGLPESGTFVAIGDAALRQQLASTTDPDNGPGMLGYTDALYPEGSFGREYQDEKNRETDTRKRYVGTALDDQGTPDAVFLVDRLHSINTSPHAFRDQTVFEPPQNGLAVNSFDGALTLQGSTNIDHAISFQSRITHDSTGAVTILYGGGTFNVQNGEAVVCIGYRVNDRHYGKFGGIYGVRNQPEIHTSDGGYVYGLTHEPNVVLSGSHITNSIGLRVEPVAGAGTVDSEYGVYIKAFTKGTNKRPIWVEKQPAGAQNYIGCDTDVDGNIRVTGDMVLAKGANQARILSGTGAPDGVVAAPVGSIFLRMDASAGTPSLYSKQSGGSGSSGWRSVQFTA